MHICLRKPLLEACVHGMKLFLPVGLGCGGILLISLYFIASCCVLWFLKICIF